MKIIETYGKRDGNSYTVSTRTVTYNNNDYIVLCKFEDGTLSIRKIKDESGFGNKPITVKESECMDYTYAVGLGKYGI